MKFEITRDDVEITLDIDYHGKFVHDEIGWADFCVDNGIYYEFDIDSILDENGEEWNGELTDNEMEELSMKIDEYEKKQDEEARAEARMSIYEW